MDEYRSRYETGGRHEPHPPPCETCHDAPPPVPPPRGLLGQFGLPGGLGEYLPILLILLGALGVYLWLDKQNMGLGGLLGGFMK